MTGDCRRAGTVPRSPVRRAGRLLAVATVLAASAVPTTEPAGASATATATAARVLCRITDPRIAESSGLVAAGDRLYTSDDGGDALVVYVLDRSCRVVRLIRNALDPFDVEDLARTPDGRLWLADTGDNRGTRRTVALEVLTADGAGTLYRLRYPDGPHDAEALLLAGDGLPYLVTKELLGAGVYAPAGPLQPGQAVELRQVARLSFTPTGTPGGPVGIASQLVVTGGAVSADGRRLVLRTYTDAYLWDVPDGDMGAALRSGRPARLPLPATAQGEAIAFDVDGRALLTSTEKLPAPVHQVPVPAGAGGPAGTGPGSPAAPSSGGPPGTSSAVPSTRPGRGVLGTRAVVGAGIVGAGVVGAAMLAEAVRRVRRRRGSSQER